MSETTGRVPLRPGRDVQPSPGSTPGLTRIGIPAAAAADPRYIGGADQSALMLGAAASQITGVLAQSAVRNEFDAAMDNVRSAPIERDGSGNLIVPDERGSLLESESQQKLRLARASTYASQYVLDKQAEVVDLRAANPTPEGFGQASTDWRNQMVDQAPAAIRPMVAQHADKLIEQHRLNITAKTLEVQQQQAAATGIQVIEQKLADAGPMIAAGREAEARAIGGPLAEARDKAMSLRATGQINGAQLATMLRTIEVTAPIQSQIVGLVARDTAAAGWISEALLQGPAHPRFDPRWAVLTETERGHLSQQAQSIVGVYRASQSYARGEAAHAASLQLGVARAQEVMFRTIVDMGGTLTNEQIAQRAANRTLALRAAGTTGNTSGLDLITPEAQAQKEREKLELIRAKNDASMTQLMRNPEDAAWLRDTMERTKGWSPEAQSQLLAAAANNFEQQRNLERSDAHRLLRQQNVQLSYDAMGIQEKYPSGVMPSADQAKLQEIYNQQRQISVELGSMTAGVRVDTQAQQERAIAQTALHNQHFDASARQAMALNERDTRILPQWNALVESVKNWTPEERSKAGALFVQDHAARLQDQDTQRGKASRKRMAEIEQQIDQIERTTKERMPSDVQKQRLESLQSEYNSLSTAEGQPPPARVSEAGTRMEIRGASGEIARASQDQSLKFLESFAPMSKELTAQLEDAARKVVGMPIAKSAEFYRDMATNWSAAATGMQKRADAAAEIDNIIRGDGAKITGTPTFEQNRAVADYVNSLLAQKVPYEKAIEMALKVGFVPDWVTSTITNGIVAGGEKALRSIRIDNTLMNSSDPLIRKLYQDKVPEAVRGPLKGKMDLIQNLDLNTQSGQQLLQGIVEDMTSLYNGGGGNVSQARERLGKTHGEQQTRLEAIMSQAWQSGQVDENGFPTDAGMTYDKLPPKMRAFAENATLHLRRHIGSDEYAARAAISLTTQAFVFVKNSINPATGMDIGPGFTPGTVGPPGNRSGLLTDRIAEYMFAPKGEYIERVNTIAGYPAVSSEGRGMFTPSGSDQRPNMDWLNTHLPTILNKLGADPKQTTEMRPGLNTFFAKVPNQPGWFTPWIAHPNGYHVPLQVMGPDGKPTAAPIMFNAADEAAKITEQTRIWRMQNLAADRAAENGEFQIRPMPFMGQSNPGLMPTGGASGPQPTDIPMGTR